MCFYVPQENYGRGWECPRGEGAPRDTPAKVLLAVVIENVRRLGYPFRGRTTFVQTVHQRVPSCHRTKNCSRK